MLAEAIAPSEVTYENYLTILTVEYYFDQIGTNNIHSLAHDAIHSFILSSLTRASFRVSLPATYTSIATTFILFPIIRYVLVSLLPSFFPQATSYR